MMFLVKLINNCFIRMLIAIYLSCNGKNQKQKNESLAQSVSLK